MRASARTCETFAPAGSSVAAARRLVSTTLSQWELEELDEDARLLVSELVTNAVVHAGTDLELTIALLAETVEISVTDRHPVRGLPALPLASRTSTRADGA